MKEIEGHNPPSRELLMEILSERYGWTPSQIRNESEDDLEKYLAIISVRKQLEEREQKKQEKQIKNTKNVRR